MKSNKISHNKKAICAMSVALTVTLAMTCFTTYNVSAEKIDGTEETNTVVSENDVLKNVKLSEKNVGKDEIVYFFSKADGTITKTLVSEHLTNKDGKDELKDSSSLSDIVNVKGDEQFTQSGNEIIWQANGKDIYYQGTTNKQAPVTEKVTYKLDGEEISPSDLKGKSGKVEIKFEYTNNTSFSDTINNEKINVCVPFAAITGLVLNDGFSNVEIDNGKLINSGKGNIALGYGLPGLKNCLKINDKNYSGKLKIPDSFTLTADVKDFSLETAMTIVVNATDMASIDGLNDLSEIDELVNNLTDAGQKLISGSSKIADGLVTLNDNLLPFKEGMITFSKGLKDYTSGASDINNGAAQLKNGVGTLNDKTPSLINGVKSLKDGSNQASTGANSLVAGFEGTTEVSGLLDGSKNLAKGASDLNDGAQKISAGVSSLTDGIASQLEETKKAIKENFKNQTGMDYDEETIYNNTIAGLKELKNKLNTANSYSEDAIKMEAAAKALMENGDTEGATKAQTSKVVLENMAKEYYSNAELIGTLIKYGMIPQGTPMIDYNTAKALYTGIDGKIDALETGKGKASGAIESLNGVETNLAQNKDITKLVEGAKDLAYGTSNLKDGASKLSNGIDAAYKGTKQLSDGLFALNGGLGTLNDSTSDLKSGVTKLNDGANTLLNGSNKLISNNNVLISGISDLLNGTNSIIDGVESLKSGSQELKDGILKFNDEAIKKISDSYNGDIKAFLNKAQAVMHAGNDYQSFGDKDTMVSGSVKFIYKLEPIK